MKSESPDAVFEDSLDEETSLILSIIEEAVSKNK